MHAIDANCLPGDSRIAAKENLFFSRRNDAVLVVEPESASWTVLDSSSLALLESLRAPRSLQEIEKEYPGIDPRRFRKHLVDLFRVQ